MTISNLTILTLDTHNITDYAAARNELLKTVQTEWVLFVDADETITKELEAEIISTIHDPRSTHYSAYYLRRLDTFMGKELKHGETGNAKFVRLAKKDFGKWERRVHEVWVGNGKVGDLSNPIIHTPHPSLATFVDKINKYSTLESQYRFNNGRTATLFNVFIYPVGKFVLNYIFRLGVLDGVPGLINAIMMSWHSYLTWGKLYLLCHSK